MKVLGKWWRGVRCICRQCGEQFTLEDGDTPYSGTHYFCAVTCPTCGGEVSVRKPFDAEVPHKQEGSAHD